MARVVVERKGAGGEAGYVAVGRCQGMRVEVGFLSMASSGLATGSCKRGQRAARIWGASELLASNTGM